MTEIFGIPTDWKFTCDKKPTAVAFNKNNVKRAEVLWLDASPLLDVDEAVNLYKGEMAHIGKYKREIDISVVSPSCKPYSISRSKRKTQGTKQHDDIRLIDVFCKTVRTNNPGAMCSGRCSASHWRSPPPNRNHHYNHSLSDVIGRSQSMREWSLLQKDHIV